MSDDGRVRIRCTVRGRVQGVAFRASTQEEARRLGVEGWVRNLSDGGVEIVAEGERHAVERLLQWAEEGPPMARVDAVDRTAETPEAEGGFRIRR